ncbi:MAG: hypothetical protein CMJ77_06100 [Planctomycetaceae bacterium]|nr:hypothetical protein [Planctomycetaceae bacterium]
MRRAFIAATILASSPLIAEGHPGHGHTNGTAGVALRGRTGASGGIDCGLRSGCGAVCNLSIRQSTSIPRNVKTSLTFTRQRR